MQKRLHGEAGMSDENVIRALIIEDVEDDALLLVDSLKRAGLDVLFRRVASEGELIDELQNDWDVVYSDHAMPGFSGTSALQVVRRYNADVPFIFVSGTMGEDRAVAAVKSGANDYIIKGNYTRLPIATERVIEEARIRRENRLAKERIDQLINIDSLTGLASRGLFLETLHNAIEQAEESRDKVGVFYINIDRFRTINDGMGIKGGDQLIVELAERLDSVLGQHGVVARLYADQFAAVVTDAQNESNIKRLADKVLDCFRKPFLIQRYHKKVTGSVGTALFPDDGEQLQSLLNNVALAQNLAKHAKGNSKLNYTATSRQNIENRLFLEAELEGAIEAERFVMHYQPQVNTTDGRIVGVESLVRWIHPERGFISPLEFISVAEESGLILPLGELICRLVCRQVENWSKAGLPSIPVAVNVSSQQFQEPGFAALLHGIMQQHSVGPDWLGLEITETALMNDPEAAQATMSELRALGLAIAMDDFGTGYSSMSYLDRFPIDMLKIDRSFVSGIPDDTRKVAIVNAVLAMAEKLRMRVVAEGIETAEQLEFLRALGCEIAQGFYLHRPVDAAGILPLLKAGYVGNRPR